MSNKIVTGIDVGTYQVKVIVSSKESAGDRRMPTVLATSAIEARGLRHGYITNLNEVIKSIRLAVSEAEKKAQIQIKKAYISVGGIGLQSIVINGVTMISRADLEITKLDIQKTHEAAEASIPNSFSLNRKIIHSIPLQYKIDGKQALGNPEGMKGARIEVKMLFVTCLEQHLNELIQAVEETGVEVMDVMASPLAASLVTLNKTQKIAGCVLANIGAETVSIAVFENNMPTSLEVFPIGSTDITNDIALGLKVPLDEAEHIKIGAITGASYSRKKIEEIVSARLSDIFDLIEAHLKKIGRNGLLPAGIIITGGGSGLSNIEDLAKASLRLPSKIARITGSENSNDSTIIKDSTWAVAYGLCIFGINADEGPAVDIGMYVVRKTRNKILAWFKQFLP